MLCIRGMWIDVYSAPTLALLGSLCSFKSWKRVWAIHFRWLRWSVTNVGIFFWPVLGLCCGLWTFGVCGPLPPWAIADDVVTSSTAVAQHGQGQSKPLTHCALQGHTSHGRTLATILALWVQGVCKMQTAATSPGKFFILPFFSREAQIRVDVQEAPFK